MSQSPAPILLSFGEILWDIIEGQHYLGGAPFNLAAHAARLELDSWLISRVGDDALGRDALKAAATYGVHTEAISLAPAHPTGTVTVALTDGQPTYTIHTPVAWDFIESPTLALRQASLTAPNMICFGTLAQRRAMSQQTLNHLLDDFAETPAFFDVNLRADCFDSAIIEAGLHRASIVKLNDVEAQRLSPLVASGRGSLEGVAGQLRDRYHIDVVLVTLGSDGCLVADATGITHVSGHTVTVVDAVGAGDAFSAAFLAAYLCGKPAIEAAAVGNQLGAYVATQRGAVPEGMAPLPPTSGGF